MPVRLTRTFMCAEQPIYRHRHRARHSCPDRPLPCRTCATHYAADVTSTSLARAHLHALVCTAVKHRSFYDFDTTQRVRECIVAHNAAEAVITEDTTLERIDDVNMLLPASSAGVNATAAPVSFCATARGVGADNPTHPTTLNDLERSRAVLFSFEDAEHADVTIAVQQLPGAPTSGISRQSRLFLFSGYSNVLLPLCPFPPSTPPSPPMPHEGRLGRAAER